MKWSDSDASRADIATRQRFRRGGPPLFLGPQLWEEDDVADRRLVGKQHNQTVDTDAFACGGRHTVLQGAQEVLIDQMRFFVARGSLNCLPFKPLALIQRI